MEIGKFFLHFFFRFGYTEKRNTNPQIGESAFPNTFFYQKFIYLNRLHRTSDTLLEILRSFSQYCYYLFLFYIHILNFWFIRIPAIASHWRSNRIENIQSISGGEQAARGPETNHKFSEFSKLSSFPVDIYH